MNKKQSFKLIDGVYFKIKDVLESIHWGGYHKLYYDLNLKEESGHRKFRPESITCGLTKTEAVKLFYVKEIIRALFKPVFIPAIKDYLSIRPSIFMAHSLVANYREELGKALQGVDYELILKVDYVELMK